VSIRRCAKILNFHFSQMAYGEYEIAAKAVLDAAGVVYVD
jgi:hypothetical protein